jgi:hypothetical protein
MHRSDYLTQILSFYSGRRNIPVAVLNKNLNCHRQITQDGNNFFTRIHLDRVPGLIVKKMCIQCAQVQEKKIDFSHANKMLKVCMASESLKIWDSPSASGGHGEHRVFYPQISQKDAD